MTDWDDDLVDRFLAELRSGDAAALVTALGRDGPAPLPSLRDRLLVSAELDGRFDRFIERAAGMLDVDPERAKALLDGIGRGESWYQGLVPEVKLYDITGGPNVANAITGFVRMPAGVPFPEHGHLGVETQLIIQGSGIDHRGEIWRPGDVVVNTHADLHSFRARPGPDLVFLVVAQSGIRIGDLVLGPDDPRV